MYNIPQCPFVQSINKFSSSETMATSFSSSSMEQTIQTRDSDGDETFHPGPDSPLLEPCKVPASVYRSLSDMIV